MKVRFYLDRKSSTVYAEVFFHKHDRHKFSTGIGGATDENFIGGEFVGAEKKRHNATLSAITNRLFDVYNHYLLMHVDFRAKDIVSFFQNGREKIDFEEIIADFLAHKKAVLKAESYLGDYYKLKSVLEFHSKVPFNDQASWLGLFETWAKKTKQYKHNHYAKIANILLQAFKFALQNGKIRKNPFEHTKIKREKKADKTPDYLDETEIQVLELTKIANPNLSKVRDCFLFQVYTGFAFNEVKHFDYKTHSYEYKGLLCVRLRRGKTGELVELPMPSKAKALLEKYRFKMPLTWRNDKYNRYLKEVFELCNITKPCYSHIGRKTAGNYWLNVLGLPVETVARMMGHKNPKTTLQYYARVHINRVVDDIVAAGVVF
jgi:integrase